MVTIKPIITGKSFGVQVQMDLPCKLQQRGISAQGINVPPHPYSAICPSAVNVAVPWPSAVPKRLAMEPASDIPEKPDPSKPVMTPTMVNVPADTY